MHSFWRAITDFLNPERKLNSTTNNDNQQQQSSTHGGKKSDKSIQNRMMSMGFPIFSDPQDIFSIFEDQMNQMRNHIMEHSMNQFDGTEYIYENKDDNGNYIKVYRFESGPNIFIDGINTEIEQGQPKNIRDLILKPEYRKKKKEDSNLDGKIGIEDIRKRFF